MAENQFNYIIVNDEIYIGQNTTTCGNGFKNKDFNGNLTIPDTIEGKDVTIIGQYAFCANKNITTLELPTTLREVHYLAFDQCRLQIENLYLPHIEHIYTFSFTSNKIKNIAIGPNIKQIDICPFSSNLELLSITVDSANQYYSNDFQYCLYNKKQTILIQVPMGKDKIIIPNTIQEICNKSFEGSKVKELIIPESCIQLDYEAINRCNSLEKIFIYSTLSKSVESCFHLLSKLTSVYYLNSNIVELNLFLECNSLSTIYTCNAYNSEYFANKSVTKQNWECTNSIHNSCRIVKSQLIKIHNFFLYVLFL